MKDGRVFIFPSSGTGAWESAIENTLAPGDKVLMSRFGQFSLLWVDMAERLGLKVELCDEEWGTGVPLEKYADILAKDKNHEIKAVFATHNETATGVFFDIAGVRKALDAAKHPALLFVDGVSSVGSLDMRMGEWGVDACVSGSQKGFMLPNRPRHPCRQPEGARRQQERQRPHEPLLLLLGRHDQDERSWIFPVHARHAVDPRLARFPRPHLRGRASITSSRVITVWQPAFVTPSMHGA